MYDHHRGVINNDVNINGKNIAENTIMKGITYI